MLIASGKVKQRGYAVITDPAQGQPEEVDSCTCGHCGAVVWMKPFQDGAAMGGLCTCWPGGGGGGGGAGAASTLGAFAAGAIRLTNRMAVSTIFVDLSSDDEIMPLRKSGPQVLEEVSQDLFPIAPPPPFNSWQDLTPTLQAKATSIRFQPSVEIAVFALQLARIPVASSDPPQIVARKRLEIGEHVWIAPSAAPAPIAARDLVSDLPRPSPRLRPLNYENYVSPPFWPSPVISQWWDITPPLPTIRRSPVLLAPADFFGAPPRLPVFVFVDEQTRRPLARLRLLPPPERETILSTAAALPPVVISDGELPRRLRHFPLDLSIAVTLNQAPLTIAAVLIDGDLPRQRHPKVDLEAADALDQIPAPTPALGWLVDDQGRARLGHVVMTGPDIGWFYPVFTPFDADRIFTQQPAPQRVVRGEPGPAFDPNRTFAQAPISVRVVRGEPGPEPDLDRTFTGAPRVRIFTPRK